MPLLILLLFVGVPILEIIVFIEAGSIIGLWPTIAIVLATGIAGTILLRIQGYSVIRRIREQSDQGKVPVFALFEGLCLFAAGLLLLTPGFVTDTVGFLLFLPPLRSLMARFIAARITVLGATGSGFGPGPGQPHPQSGRGSEWSSGPGSEPGGPIIDGDYEPVPRDTPPRS